MSQSCNNSFCKALSIVILSTFVFFNLSCDKTSPSEEAEVFPVEYGNLRCTAKTICIGDVYSDDIYSFEFNFINISKHDIEIIKTVSSCTCTDAIVKPDLIMPGKNGSLSGKIHFKSKSGQNEEQIIIEASDGNQYLFKINANVIEHYAAKPSFVDFGEVWWDDTLQATVYIDSQSKHNSSELLQLLPGYHHSIKTEITSSDEKRWRVDIVVNNPPVGNFHQRLFLETNNPRQPKIVIPIRANVLGPITTKPETLFFGSISSNDKIQSRLVVCRKPGVETQIRRISAQKIPIVTDNVFFRRYSRN